MMHTIWLVTWTMLHGPYHDMGHMGRYPNAEGTRRKGTSELHKTFFATCSTIHDKKFLLEHSQKMAFSTLGYLHMGHSGPEKGKAVIIMSSFKNFSSILEYE